MTVRIILLLTIFFFGIHCGNESAIPRSPLDFSQMEVHYVKALPRSNTIGLAVYPDGSAHAYLFAGVALRDTLSRNSKILSPEEQASLGEWFGPFSSFETEYSNTTISDGGYTITRLTYRGSKRQVMVLDKAKDVPKELREMLQGLDSLWESAMGDKARGITQPGASRTHR